MLNKIAYFPHECANRSRNRFPCAVEELSLNGMAAGFGGKIKPFSSEENIEYVSNHINEEGEMQLTFHLPSLEESGENRELLARLIAMVDLFHTHPYDTMYIPREYCGCMVNAYIPSFLIDRETFEKKCIETKWDVARLAEHFKVTGKFIRPMVESYQDAINGYIEDMLKRVNNDKAKEDV